MKIYFAITIQGDRSRLEHAKRLLGLLEEKNHTVLTKHIFHEDVLEHENEEKPEDIFLRDMQWLQEADIVIVEASGSSFGIGFETGYVLGALNKPLYLLYDRSVEKKISKMATGLLDENCTKIAYDKFEEVLKFFEKEL